MGMDDRTINGIRYEDYPSTKTEAIKNRIAWYFTNKPCKRNHFAPRNVKNRYCNDCKKIAVKKYTKTVKGINQRKLSEKRLLESGYYQEEKVINRKRKYYQKYREINLDKIVIYEKNYRKKNIDIITKYQKNYYKKNKEFILEKNKSYLMSDRGREAQKKSSRKQSIKIKNNPQLRLIGNIRSRIRQFLYVSGPLKKHKETRELLGCNQKYLIEYLERYFQVGMSWDNRKNWNIDHIIPLNFFNKFFDIKDISVQKIAFHYSNLQPLFKLDNIRKSNFIYLKNVQEKNGEKIIVDMNNKDYELFVFLITEQIHKKLDILKKNNTIKDIGKITSVVWNKFYKLVDE